MPVYLAGKCGGVMRWLNQLLLLLTLALFMTGCSRISFDQTPSDEEIATRVSEVLATLPGFEFKPSPTLYEPEPTATRQSTPDAKVMTATAGLFHSISTVTASPTLPPTLTVTATVTITPTITLTPTSTISPDDPRSKLGPADGTDTMTDGLAWNWGLDPTLYTSAAFTENGMMLTGVSKSAGWRLPVTQTAENMYIEAEVNSGNCRAKDSYGIMFRVPVFQEADRGYLLSFSCDGAYKLWKWDGKAALGRKAEILVDWTPSPFINAGKYQNNRIGVWTEGNEFLVYANGTHLNETLPVSDDTYTDGSFGIFIAPNATVPYSVEFLEINYWLDVKPAR